MPTGKDASQGPLGADCQVSEPSYGSHAVWWQLMPAGLLTTVPPPQPSLVQADTTLLVVAACALTGAAVPIAVAVARAAVATTVARQT
ncbi:hypothetical protein GCM10023235_02710 [Kitasatospora terrestris]|uniref:Uncharacterized protein n=1 Tax=Kitasatospora terrestris TaxID=258051 RepID=A0ABP9D6E0_9ACTN